MQHRGGDIIYHLVYEAKNSAVAKVVRIFNIGRDRGIGNNRAGEKGLNGHIAVADKISARLVSLGVSQVEVLGAASAVGGGDVPRNKNSVYFLGSGPAAEVKREGGDDLPVFIGVVVGHAVLDGYYLVVFLIVVNLLRNEPDYSKLTGFDNILTGLVCKNVGFAVRACAGGVNDSLRIAFVYVVEGVVVKVNVVVGYVEDLEILDEVLGGGNVIGDGIGVGEHTGDDDIAGNDVCSVFCRGRNSEQRYEHHNGDKNNSDFLHFNFLLKIK